MHRKCLSDSLASDWLALACQFLGTVPSYMLRSASQSVPFHLWTDDSTSHHRISTELVWIDSTETVIIGSWTLYVKLDIIRSNIIISDIIRSDILRSDIIRSDIIRSDIIRSNKIRSAIIGSAIIRSAIIRSDIIRSNIIRLAIIGSAIIRSDIIR